MATKRDIRLESERYAISKPSLSFSRLGYRVSLKSVCNVKAKIENPNDKISQHIIDVNKHTTTKQDNKIRKQKKT